MLSAQEELLRLRKECRFLRQKVATLERAHLAQKNKADKLEELLRERDKFIRELEREKDALEKLINELKRQREIYKGMVYKPNKNRQENKTITNKRSIGGQKGHPGISRKLPERIDKEFYVFAHSCPTCHTPLTRTKSIYTHAVEDIPASEITKPVTTRYTIERQWCHKCQKEVIVNPTGVIPHSKLGINLIVQILIWKYLCRMPFNIINQTLNVTYGINLSCGTLAKVLSRAKKWFGPQYQELLRQIRASPIKHADETGWRIKGINSWLWAFLTKQEVYYTIEETRGKGVAERIIGSSPPDSILIRDDYRGYEKLDLIHQSCWTHLLRKSHEAAIQPNASLEVRLLHQKLKGIFIELNQLLQKLLTQTERQQLYDHYSRELREIIETKLSSDDTKKIQERIRNQGQNLLTALLYEGVPLTNNLAERMIRPMVVTRKISGGSRTDNGAEIHAINMSIIQTIRLKNQPLIPTLQKYLLRGAFGER